MIGLTALLLLLKPTAVDVYRDLQARLARYASARLTTCPITGNGWDHEGLYGYLRPNKGFRQEPNLSFASDGRRSWGVWLHDGVRRAKRGDLAQFMGLPGFESFFNPTARVTGDAPPRSTERNGKRLVALDLTIDGRVGTLYLDAATRLPYGFADRPGMGGDPEYLPRIYLDVQLGAPVPSDYLKPPRRDVP